MMIPTVHLNGTSGQALLDQVTEAAQALYQAMRALDEAAPNARDYYPQGEDAFRQATAEHAGRAARLRSVYQELQQIAEGIADAT